MTRDLRALADNLSDAPAAELKRVLARTRAGYARIGFFPDRRRADSRAYFAVVDELTSRAHHAATPDPGRLPPSQQPQVREDQS